jgi:DNA-binding winged helix-turn-helix (wHTH) protein
MLTEDVVARPGTLKFGDFRLGDWLVQPSLNRVCSGDARHQIEPKLMDVLVYLADRAGQVVSRQEIIDAVWAKRFLADTLLTRAISELRRVLGDDARAPNLIETVSKRGYRLLAISLPSPEVTPGAPATMRAGPGTRQLDEGLGNVSVCSIAWGDLEIRLEEGNTIIGRATEALIRVASTRVSRRHARITVRGVDATLEDLGSRNGTYLRGRKLEGPAPLQDGDEICIGPAVLSFRQRQTGETTQIEGDT